MTEGPELQEKRRSLAIPYLIALVVIVFLTFAPLIFAAGAGWIARRAGCAINEAGVKACFVMGHNIGEILHVFLVLGWAIFMTIPAGAAAVCIWGLVAIVHLAVRDRKSRSEKT